MLIVEDDPEVGMSLEEYFGLKGFDVTRVTDGESGLREMTFLPPYDIVLLDVMMPKKNGFDVLREARRAGVESPVILLTVKEAHDDKMHGFDLGADDYITKPFSAEELDARVNAVLGRSTPASNAPMDRYHFDGVEVDFEAHTVQRDGEDIELTTLEFDILQYLIEHRGRTVSRKQFLRDVWGISGEVTTRTIDRHVASIRRKLESDPDQSEYIETVYGIGYKFVG